jgi:hypothetical protein
VATTEFTVEFLAQVWPTVEEEFTRREIELNIVHVRTRDFWTQLEAMNVDWLRRFHLGTQAVPTRLRRLCVACVVARDPAVWRRHP